MKNLTTGSPTRLLLTFTLPLLIGGLLQQAYQMTDAAIIGRVLGTDGLAAVGSVGALLFLLIGFSWGSTAGLAVPVSKAFGAGNLKETKTMIAAGAYVALGIAAIITVVGLVFGRPLLNLLGTPAYLVPDAAAYLQIIAGGSILAVTFGYVGAIMRAVGDTKTPLKFGIASGLLNALITFVVVARLGLGIPGAAAATLVAQTCSLTAFLLFLKAKQPQLFPSKAEWRAGIKASKESARMGLPMGLQSCAIAIGSVVLQAAVNGLGSEAIAAYTSAGRVEGIIIAPLHAFNVGVVTFVAQNRGAEQWRRIRHAVARIAVVVGGVAVALGAVQFVFARPLVGVFLHTDVGGPITLAVDYLRLTAFLFVLLGFKFVIRGAVQGMGNAAIPLASTIVELGIRTIVAFALVSALGLTGVALAAPLAWCGGLSVNVVAWLRTRKTLIRREQEAAQPSKILPISETLPQTLVRAA
ncbi:MAG: MATE family efflux transporter [Cellulomonadaceae bacterium]|jgi:putative MATE family efflux protein|nr:MATE family efflux transporter [Cellulomonadaceae bacterium]